MTDEQAPNQEPVVVDSNEQAGITKQFFDKFLADREFSRWEYDIGVDNTSIPSWVRKRETWFTPVAEGALDTLIMSQSQKFKTADRSRNPNFGKIGGVETETGYGLIIARNASHDHATGEYRYDGEPYISFGAESWATRGGTLIVPDLKLFKNPEIQLPFSEYLNGLLNTKLESEFSAIQSGNWTGDFYAIRHLIWNEVLKIYEDAASAGQAVVEA